MFLQGSAGAGCGAAPSPEYSAVLSSSLDVEVGGVLLDWSESVLITIGPDCFGDRTEPFKFERRRSRERAGFRKTGPCSKIVRLFHLPSNVHS
jgi:hypothetical protein